VVVFVAFIALLLYVDLFDFDGTAPTGQLVAAAIALVGAFGASVVTLVGLTLKHSIDVRAERRQQIDSDRNYSLEQDAAARLKLEAGLRAVELIGGQDEKPAGLQRDGALFTLASLGFHDLALVLLEDLLKRDAIEAGTASVLIDRAIAAGDAGIAADAVNIWFDFAERFVQRSYAIPGCAYYPERLPQRVREFAVIAVGKMFLGKPLAEWHTDLGKASGLLGALIMMWQSESDPRLRNEAAAIVRAVTAGFPTFNVIFHRTSDIDVGTVRKEVQDAAPQSALTKQLTERLSAWRAAG
jgi:hypothetical protein